MYKKIIAIISIVIILATFVGCGISKKIDIISGNSWEAEDGSLLCLNKDGTFHWYCDPNNKNDSYYTGTYTIYNGEDASDYTLEHLDDAFVDPVKTAEFALDLQEKGLITYYCLILNNEQFIVDGENSLDEAVTNQYHGFYDLDEDSAVLDMYNMNTSEYVTFKSHLE